MVRGAAVSLQEGPEGLQVAIAAGSVPGAQTVPRAELQAARWASQLFPAAKTVTSDASYVVNGIARLAEFEQ